MSNSQLFLISIFSSIFFHLLVIIYLDSEKVDNEIYVVSLSQFEEFNFSEPIVNPPPLPKKREQKKVRPLQKIDPKKEEIPEKELIKTKVEKKSEDVMPIKQKPIKVEEKPFEKTKASQESKNIKKKINKNESNKQIVKKKFSIQNNKNVIKNKLLSDYLKFISFEINKIAAKSYPVQSVRKREQGTIVSIIILDKSGTVISIKVKEKSPKRLFKATVNIINKFKFPKPPDEVLDSQGLLKIKIPVNFILK
ncbi:MAG: energy transducer TonB [Alphaproteobacteria bacterium]